MSEECPKWIPTQLLNKATKLIGGCASALEVGGSMAADASEGGEGTWAELRKGIEWERRTIQRTVLGPLP